MHFSNLERAVARTTGETLREIRRRGFQPLLRDDEFGLFAAEDDGTVAVGVVDWDAVEADRVVLFP